MFPITHILFGRSFFFNTPPPPPFSPPSFDVKNVSWSFAFSFFSEVKWLSYCLAPEEITSLAEWSNLHIFFIYFFSKVVYEFMFLKLVRNDFCFGFRYITFEDINKSVS